MRNKLKSLLILIEQIEDFIDSLLQCLLNMHLLAPLVQPLVPQRVVLVNQPQLYLRIPILQLLQGLSFLPRDILLEPLKLLLQV